MPLSLCQMKVIFSSFYSHWWRVLSAGGMWSVGLWLSANLRGIKDSVPPNTLCTERCWKETYSEVKQFQTVHQKLCNGTKNCATTSTTVQRHQKLCNMTKNCVKQCTKKACNGTKNCATAPKTAAHLITNSGMSSAPHPPTARGLLARFSQCSEINFCSISQQVLGPFLSFKIFQSFANFKCFLMFSQWSTSCLQMHCLSVLGSSGDEGGGNLRWQSAPFYLCLCLYHSNLKALQKQDGFR